MAKYSKDKGSKFENEMCKSLNEMYETKEFVRTPGSGAFMGRSNWFKKKGLSDVTKVVLGSDLIVPDDFSFSVECKWYKDDPNYATVIKGPDSMLDKWIGETLVDSINLQKSPLLFFKTNNKGIHAVLYEDFSEVIDDIPYYTKYESFRIIGINYFTEYHNKIKEFAANNNKTILENIENNEHCEELIKRLK